MAVRGTSLARHTKKIIIREGAEEGGRILCAWDECDNDAVQLHVLRVHDQHKPGFGPPSRYAFCSRRHLLYWTTSHKPGQYGRLPAGERLTIT